MSRAASWLLGGVLVAAIAAATAQLVVQQFPAPPAPVVDTTPVSTGRIVLPASADSGRYHGAYPDVGENDEAPPTAFTPSQLFHSHESRKDP